MPDTHDPSFFSELLRAPTFPLRGDGIMLTLMACAWLFVTQLLSGCVPVAGLIVSLAGIGFFYAYLMRVVTVTADGDDELPAFQEISSWWDDGLVPSFQIIFLLFLYFGPAIWLLVSENETGALVAAGVAVFLLPMGLLNLSLRTSLLDPAPAWQIKTILSAPLPYLVSVLCMSAVTGLQWWITGLSGDVQGDDMVSTLAIGAVTLPISVYANFINAFVLGRFYYCNEVELE